MEQSIPPGSDIGHLSSVGESLDRDIEYHEGLARVSKELY
jgi:hypothetical protein